MKYLNFSFALLLIFCLKVTIGCTKLTTENVELSIQPPDLPIPDTIAPLAPTVTSPANNSTATSQTIIITGSCETLATVLLSGDISVSPTTTRCLSSEYSRSISLAPGNGIKSIQITQRDVAGNGSPQILLNLTLDVPPAPDTTPPTTPTVASPANNSIVPTQSITITGTCETLATVLMTGSITGSSNSVTCVNSAYSRSVTLTTGNGAKSIQITQQDLAGNTSAQRILNLTLDIPVSNPGWTSTNYARVLLSGHSLTDNPLIDYVESIAMSRSDNFNYNQQIVLGSPIRLRTKGNDPNSAGWSGYSMGKNKGGGSGLNLINEIRNPQTIGTGNFYDTLFITENHNSLEQIQWENTIPYLRHYHDLMLDGNLMAKTLFYHSWLDINKSAPNNWITHEKNARTTWECVASKVNQSLGDTNQRPQVQSLPSGGALVDLVEKAIANQVNGLSGTTIEKLNLIFSDNVHLTSMGAYYMSLVTYSSVFRKSPVGTPAPSGISAALATSLQSIAWTYINTYYSQTAPGVRTMSECRSAASTYCSSYWTLKNNTGNISGCTSFYTSNITSPFADANFVVFPAP